MQLEVPPSIDWVPAPDIIGASGEVVLRRWELSDASLLLKANGDPKLADWTSVPFLCTTQEAENWISNRNAETDKGSGAYFVAEVDGFPVGSVNVLKIDVYQSVAEIGYWLEESLRGKGIGRCACKVLLDWLKTLGFRRIQLTVNRDNEASIGLAESLGFMREAVLHSYGFNRYGEREDVVLYALIIDEV